MRAVTEQIKTAFDNGQKKTVNNTWTDGQAVWLHGNKIVERRDDGVYFCMCGWGTPTTRERINGITGAGIYQKNHTQMRDGEDISTTDWIRI